MMEFNPNNPIIQRCIQAMALEESGQAAEAGELFIAAWNDTTNELEKFIIAYHLVRHQKTVSDKLKWLQTALQFAITINDDSVAPAFVNLHESIAKCYEELSDFGKAAEHDLLAKSINVNPSENGPFYHGTKADLQIGDLLTAGYNSNYKSARTMNHIYFTALVNGAGLAAALAKGDGRERVYIVEPTGSFENDPNVTNKRFPGNPTRSYRTEAPLKIVGEVTGWATLTSEEVLKWREKLANNKGEIIN